ncbi:D-alanine transaminase [Rhizomicrobium palustre]|uniref:Probable branched-chain-amino-acid aminotransferase n=1 Tax=Rhizomicrobium palustre TaxID=189966 RepID=A0A846N1X3_9PROT|nr:D-amino-acid transaminase [Rhizomicrobium palustre]NIK89974.1 D-alanine transaminase [Rhizomicrobium palustre]
MKWSPRKPAGRIAYVDGRYVVHGEAGVHVEDRGLQLGDSVYEVWRLRAGRLLDLEEHFDRLERSLGEIAMAMPMSRAAFKQVLSEIVRRNTLTDGIVYLQVTRGSVRRDHPLPDNPPKPSVILTARRLDTAALDKKLSHGISVITLADERWGRCDIKSTQLLANALAKTAGKKAGAGEVWLVDRDGFVTEGASTTAWIVDLEGRLRTRPLSSAILPGVTRRMLLQVAEHLQIPVLERAFTVKEAKAAREAFISSATSAAMPVIAIDGVHLGDGTPGPVTLALQAHYLKQA